MTGQPIKWRTVRNLHPLADGVMFRRYTDLPKSWWQWENFLPHEFACRRTGEFYYHARTFESFQKSRTNLGKAHHINSGHRSRLYNTAVGGAPRSAHLLIAGDVSTRNHDRFELYLSLKLAGFRSFGFYSNFIHADHRLGRMWYGSHAAKRIWEPLLEMSKKADYLL